MSLRSIFVLLALSLSITASLIAVAQPPVVAPADPGPPMLAPAEPPSVGPATLAPADATPAAPEADSEGFYSLFDGNSLTGWKVAENEKAFKVQEGELIAGGSTRGHLFYEGPVNDHDFKNFEFKAKVKNIGVSNSGIYIHTKFQDKGWPTTGFECQVCSRGL